MALMGGLLGAGCASDQQTQRPAPSAAAPIVVDTDVASDDLLAVAAVASDPRLDLRAVTVVGTGEAHCGPGVAVVLDLLMDLRKTDVPVSCGRAKPLAGDHHFPEEWRSLADRAYGVPLPRSTESKADVAAPQLLARSLDGATLLALGPLTNVADAFALDPRVARQVKRVVVSGGALDVPGNLGDAVRANSVAEWNMYIDPVAADRVLHSGAQVTFVPLDVTTTLPVTLDLLERLDANAHRTTAAGFAAALLDGNPQVALGELYFWDPAAALLASDPSLFTLTRRRVRVETADGPSAGRTLVDSVRGVPVETVSSADADKFSNRWLELLTGAGGQALDEPKLAPVTWRGSIEAKGRTCALSGAATAPPGRFDVIYRGPAGTAGALAHLRPGSAGEELGRWLADHPRPTEPPPMLDSLTVVDPAVGHVRAPLTHGEWVAACFTIGPDDSFTDVVLGDTIAVD